MLRQELWLRNISVAEDEAEIFIEAGMASITCRFLNGLPRLFKAPDDEHEAGVL